jgi:hypothetical protein
MVKQKHQCPVCGYSMAYPARDNNICPSCGTEFGYHDAGRSFFDIRKEWVRDGAPWSSHYIQPPENWNPTVQMLTVGLTVNLRVDSDNQAVDRKPVHSIERSGSEKYRLIGATA